MWALEAYGAAHTLRRCSPSSLTTQGRVKTYEAIVKGEPIEPGVPASFRVLVKAAKPAWLSGDHRHRRRTARQRRGKGAPAEDADGPPGAGWQQAWRARRRSKRAGIVLARFCPNVCSLAVLRAIAPLFSSASYAGGVAHGARWAALYASNSCTMRPIQKIAAKSYRVMAGGFRDERVARCSDVLSWPILGWLC